VPLATGAKGFPAMTRTVGTLAVVALLLVPDWATAFGWRARRWVRPFRAPSPPAAMVLLPPCLPVIPVTPYAPPAPATLRPPTVQVVPEAGAAADKPRGIAPAPADPATDIRPAGNLATPTAAPPDPPKTTSEAPARSQVIDAAPPPKPAEEKPESRLPKTDLPLPSLPGNGSKADAPAAGKIDSPVPPIVLPQLPPVPAAGAKTESKYRPAAGDRPSFAVLPVDGVAPAGANPAWQVGFFNYTGRDLELRVEGQAVALPARSYVTAKVPGTFTWRVGTGADETTTIPAASGGVEIVLK
jgi:hypothetical protein